MDEQPTHPGYSQGGEEEAEDPEGCFEDAPQDPTKGLEIVQQVQQQRLSNQTPDTSTGTLGSQEVAAAALGYAPPNSETRRSSTPLSENKGNGPENYEPPAPVPLAPRQPPLEQQPAVNPGASTDASAAPPAAPAVAPVAASLQPQPPQLQAQSSQGSQAAAAIAYANIIHPQNYLEDMQPPQQPQQQYISDLSPETSTDTSAAAQEAAAALARQQQQQHIQIQLVKKNRRTCKFPGCTKAVKSQGHCQAHGAKAKRCSVEGCDKQAQTTHEGMCKRHWKLKNLPPEPATSDPGLKSVYETILPQSIAFRPMAAAKAQEKSEADSKLTGGNKDPLDPSPAPEGAIVMPLVAYLQDGSTRPLGWHRNEEREAKGLRPMANLSAQLEPWERQLAIVEILLLGGGTPYASFQNLAHGWGRKKGFHSALVNEVCEQRVGMIRKRKREVAESSVSEPYTV